MITWLNGRGGGAREDEGDRERDGERMKEIGRETERETRERASHALRASSPAEKGRLAGMFQDAAGAPLWPNHNFKSRKSKSRDSISRF